MTSKKKKSEHNFNPLVSANLTNKLFFWWLKDLTWYGNKHDLEATDIYDTIPEDTSKHLINKIEKAWENQILNAQNNEKRPSLYAVGMKIYGGKLLKYMSLLILVGVIQIIYPILLEAIMAYFHSSSQMTSTNAYFLATIFTITLISESVLRHYGIFKLTRLGMHLKIVCSQLIFKKILRMPATTMKEKSFANLLSNDVNKIEIVCSLFYHLVIIPLQSIAMTYMMSYYAGVIPALIGILLMILQTLPLQVIVYKVTLKLRAKQAIKTDTRIFLISEVINGIRAIKIYVWEEHFMKLLSDTRRREISDYLKISYVHALMSSISNCNSRVSLLFMIMIHTLRDGILTSSQVVPLMKILWTLKERCSMVFLAVKSQVDANVSISRIENFLLGEEIGLNVQTCINDNINQSKDIISIQNVIASWNLKENDKVLDNISIKIHRNKLCVIVGSVGTGKSTLVKLMLGELLPVSGKVCVNGKVSYVDQHPWLFKGSIRDNILFGEKYNHEKYQRVVEACALLEDFSQLPYGDKTLVGESGSMLSGGQRTRVSLARAVYREADIYLLDDPFSSLDVRVANEIFKNCIYGLLNDKTRVLVTSNPQYISKANLIVVLKNGSIEYQGPFVKSHLFDQSSNSLEHNVPGTFFNSAEHVNNDTILFSKSSKSEPKETDEFLAKGNISNKVIREYLKAGKSYFNVFLWVLGSVLLVILAAIFDYWIVVWSQEQDVIYKNVTNGDLNTIDNNVDLTKFLLMIGGLIVALMISAITKNLIFNRFTLIASKTIHENMIASLIRGPLKYFQLNSSGRILNRFAEDTGNVDNVLPKGFYEQTQGLIMVVTLLLPVVIINWRYSIPIFILIYLLYQVYKFCVPSMRSIKRLERIAKSPVLASAASCYAGRLTIRCYRAEEFVSDEFSIHLDHHTAAYFLSIASAEGFNLLIELLTNALFAFIIYTSVLLKDNVESAGYVGLSLAQVMNMTASLVYVLRQSIDIVSCMINLERMIQFTKLEQEELLNDEPEIKPPTSWPSTGKLEFQHIYLRYSDEVEPALKDINLVIEPGTKIGIVGRTGAGKSSLVSVLFRLTKIDGSLIIDDIDTKHVNLSVLRSKISIIPQQATLFNTSLRKNLDPLNIVDDATLWAALNDVDLQSTFDSLEYIIDKDGGNLSFGQRQLLSLARVIVKKNKILVLDEATANLDAATEAIIQKTIKVKFGDCTVISVAHKLSTIIESDKVLVMDNGQVVEYDHPHLLLQRQDSYFSGMVNQTSDSMIQQLKSIAEKTYIKD